MWMIDDVNIERLPGPTGYRTGGSRSVDRRRGITINNARNREKPTNQATANHETERDSHEWYDQTLPGSTVMGLDGGDACMCDNDKTEEKQNCQSMKLFACLFLHGGTIERKQNGFSPHTTTTTLGHGGEYNTNGDVVPIAKQPVPLKYTVSRRATNLFYVMMMMMSGVQM
jgi:hypothetical protein